MSDNYKINFENILYQTLNQEASLFLNKKILSHLGLELTCFLSFLIDKGKYHKANQELTSEGYFYATDMDIYLFTTIPRNKLPKLKAAGIKNDLFKIKKEGNPVRTYYKLNFEKILSLLSTETSVLELAYERAFQDNEEVLKKELSESSLIKLSYKDLRLLCKKLNIPYSGKDLKSDLIKNILQHQNKDTLESNESKWTEKPSQKITKEKQQIKKIKNSEVDFFENLFEEFGIVYTNSNRESVTNLLKKLSIHEVESYLRETFDNLTKSKDIKNIGAVFSSLIKKGLRQVNSQEITKKELITKNTDEDKQQADEFIKKLFSDEKNKVEDEAITKEQEQEILDLMKTDKNINFTLITQMKSIAPTIFYNTLKNYKKNNAISS